MMVVAKMSNMQLTSQLGTDFWNDSCDPRELGEAVQEGAVGATSNPVIVHQAVLSARELWIPVLDELVRQNGGSTEDEIAWKLIAEVGRRAAALLRPVYDATHGLKGYLSMQVNPKFFASAERMVNHAHELASIAPNVAIKIPATSAGLTAIEHLTGECIRINATVCFTIAQALACAEAVERGVVAAQAAGRDTSRLYPTVTLMVGRLDDHLRRVMERDEITVDPGDLNWAGVAAFKKAHGIFRGRPYRSTLLAAAYRCHMHWTELIGERVIQTMPYKWWKQFNASRFTPTASVAQPVAPRILQALCEHFVDFRRAYDEDGLEPAEFARYGASVHTLQQFLDGYHKLVELVRGRVLSA